MGRDEGDVGRGWRGVSGGRETSVRIGVEDGEIRSVNRVEKFETTSVVVAGVPTVTVGVEVADDDRIAIRMIKETNEVRFVVNSVT